MPILDEGKASFPQVVRYLSFPSGGVVDAGSPFIDHFTAIEEVKTLRSLVDLSISTHLNFTPWLNP